MSMLEKLLLWLLLLQLDLRLLLLLLEVLLMQLMKVLLRSQLLMIHLALDVLLMLFWKHFLNRFYLKLIARLWNLYLLLCFLQLFTELLFSLLTRQSWVLIYHWFLKRLILSILVIVFFQFLWHYFIITWAFNLNYSWKTINFSLSFEKSFLDFFLKVGKFLILC